MSNAVAQPYPPAALPLSTGTFQHPPWKQSSQCMQPSYITLSEALHLTGTGLIFLSGKDESQELDVHTNLMLSTSL